MGIYPQLPVCYSLCVWPPKLNPDHDGGLKMGAITKRMTTIKEMAGMDVLCSDKTGTLTLNKLTVDKNMTESPCQACGLNGHKPSQYLDSYTERRGKMRLDGDFYASLLRGTSNYMPIDSIFYMLCVGFQGRFQKEASAHLLIDCPSFACEGQDDYNRLWVIEELMFSSLPSLSEVGLALRTHRKKLGVDMVDS